MELLQIATPFLLQRYDTVYYKLRQVLQSAMDLLQIATGITKCDDYYKLRQYTCQMSVCVVAVRNSLNECFL